MIGNRRAAAALLAFAVLGTARFARADDAAARESFRHGVDLYDRKQYEPALSAFRKAYEEKPSSGIKQNIALCLKALGRPVEAARAFDEALDEGQGALTPEVQAAMDCELGDLAKVVATVRLRVVSSTDHTAIADVIVSVDGAPLSAAALARPVRLAPGIHVFSARAARRADPPDKKLSLLAGSPVDATFEIAPPPGRLTVKPNVPDAVVQIDGKVVPRDGFPLSLPGGKHRVSVSAPGYPEANTEVTVSPDADTEYPIALIRPGDIAPYEPALRPPPPVKARYVVPMVAYAGQSLRLAPVLGERAGGSKRDFTGGAVAVRGGYRVSKNFAVELYGEVGQTSSSYTLGSVAESTTDVVGWQVTPGLRFATVGGIRFTTGMGAGLHGQVATANLRPAALTTTPIVNGHGVSASWLADLGTQFDVGPVFCEVVGFLDVHGVGTTRDDVTNQRLFLSSPSTRTGVRIGVGIPF